MRVGRVLARLLIAVLGLASGSCSLINAATGDPFCVPGQECCTDGEDNDGDGDVDCVDADCTETEFCGACLLPELHDAGELPLSNHVFDTCDQIVSSSEIRSAQGSACNFMPSLSIVKFTSPRRAERRLCMNYTEPGTGSLSGNGCGEGLQCLPLDGNCRDLVIDEGEFFLLVPASPGDGCGELTLDITDTGNEICLNGTDDTEDMFVDCEDPTCQGDPNPSMCHHPLGVPGEICNGLDDGNGGGGSFPSGSIDEAACRCVSNDGCNNLQTGNAPSYICHTEAPDGGVCAPRCSELDWCPSVGMVCGGLACVPSP